jgi:hypothetical protein
MVKRQRPPIEFSAVLVVVYTISRPFLHYYLLLITMSVPDGCYPRINAAMCLSNTYEGTLVSVVGRYTGQQFQCSDGGLIALNTEYIEQPPDLDK